MLTSMRPGGVLQARNNGVYKAGDLNELQARKVSLLLVTTGYSYAR